MQVVKKLLFWFILFWGALLLFMPKEELYFSMERELAKQGVEINEGAIHENLFGLTLEDATVYVQGIQVATIHKVSLFTLLFYTRIEADTLKVEKSLRKMLPEEVDQMVITYAIIAPQKVHIEAQGSFGKLEGEVSLPRRTIHLDFVETGNIEAIRAQLKKGEKGWYYETSF